MAWGLLLALCGLLAPAAAGGHHSLSVLVTAIINEDGTHHFIMIARLDDVKIANYRSDTREVRPTQEWVARTLGAEYFQEKTQQFWRHEEGSKVETRRWMQLYNQTGGIHTEQVHVGCALSHQAPMDPRYQFAYDGRDFISFDNQTGTWVAAVQPAFLQKQRWEAEKLWTQYVQHVLQSECLGTLRSLVQRGSAVLEQQVSPKVSISRTDSPDGSVILSCRARGFYPRPIHVSWVRDGEDILAEKYSSGILPNDIHSYYTQSSLEISPQQEDGHRYACRVEHSSLPEPVLVWEMADPSVNLIKFLAVVPSSVSEFHRLTTPWEEGPPAPRGPGRHRPGRAGSGWSRRGRRRPVEEKISRPLRSGSHIDQRRFCLPLFMGADTRSVGRDPGVGGALPSR
ncbi:class I histocompatibility antigen, F10 alpha chain-like [Mauremys reevesii]|uniref:class I histocompatibility antigen, F10 alpha chain-like n=1 Tax=Mauremys reevesii TaxID=260615 RepID=UPI00193F6930|nr:class I histocompatibility antigen, F10 alpha chain-like [Mauremys reevesii]